MEDVRLVRATRCAVAASVAVVVLICVCVLATRQAIAAAIGPVCIPGQATLPLTADAKVSRDHPNRNYGSDSHWKINYPATLRSFINFRLPDIPSACTVKEATLEVAGTESGSPHPATSWPGAEINFYLASGRWSERGITWNNKPRGYGCFGTTQDYANSGSLLITGTIQDAYRCLETGRLPRWNGIKLTGWTANGRRANWRFVVDSRQSGHPPIVKMSWG